MENKAFFELILISNVHGLAPFFYDWTTESLFVCVMKHIEGYVSELKLVCERVCSDISKACVFESISFACICNMGGSPHSFWLISNPSQS